MTDFVVNRIDKDSSSVTHGMWLRFGARLRVAKLRPLHRARHKQSICLQQLNCASIPFLYSPSRLYQRNFIIFDEWCQVFICLSNMSIIGQTIFFIYFYSSSLLLSLSSKSLYPSSSSSSSCILVHSCQFTCRGATESIHHTRTILITIPGASAWHQFQDHFWSWRACEPTYF